MGAPPPGGSGLPPVHRQSLTLVVTLLWNSRRQRLGGPSEGPYVCGTTTATPLSTSAHDRALPLVYEELHRLARHYMRRERPAHSLQATALVNEAYMRLADYTRMRWQDRAHFFAVSAQVMRRILVDHARRHNVKRGRGVQHVSLDDVAAVAPREECRKDSLGND